MKVTKNVLPHGQLGLSPAGELLEKIENRTLSFCREGGRRGEETGYLSSRSYLLLLKAVPRALTPGTSVGGPKECLWAERSKCLL